MIAITALYYNTDGLLVRVGFFPPDELNQAGIPANFKPEYRELTVLELAVTGLITISMGSFVKEPMPKMYFTHGELLNAMVYIGTEPVGYYKSEGSVHYITPLKEQNNANNTAAATKPYRKLLTRNGYAVLNNDNTVRNYVPTKTNRQFTRYTVFPFCYMQIAVKDPSWKDALLEFNVYTDYLEKADGICPEYLINPYNEKSPLCMLPSNICPVIFAGVILQNFSPRIIKFGEEMKSYILFSNPLTEDAQVIFPKRAYILQIDLSQVNYKKIQLPEHSTYFILTGEVKNLLWLPDIKADYVDLIMECVQCNIDKADSMCTVEAKYCIDITCMASLSMISYQLACNFNAPLVRYTMYYIHAFNLVRSADKLHLNFSGYSDYTISVIGDKSRTSSSVIKVNTLSVYANFSESSCAECSLTFNKVIADELNIFIFYEENTAVTAVLKFANCNISKLHIFSSIHIKIRKANSEITDLSRLEDYLSDTPYLQP